MSAIEGLFSFKVSERPPRQRKSQGSKLLEWRALNALIQSCDQGLALNEGKGVVVTPDIRKKFGKSSSRRAVKILRDRFKEVGYDVERRTNIDGNEEVSVYNPPERVMSKRTQLVREMPRTKQAAAAKRSRSKRSHKPTAAPQSQAQETPEQQPAVGQ